MTLGQYLSATVPLGGKERLAVCVMDDCHCVPIQCLGEADGQLRIPSVSAGATTRDFSALAGRILAGVEAPNAR